MVWTSGKALYGDRYIIERKIDKGEGSLGVTYLALKAQNQQRVAIKTLKEEYISNSQFAWYREKFRDEALLLSLCRHPNIVQIENYFTEDELPCIVMEYVAGEDLWNIVNDRGILSEVQAVNYIRKIGEALTVVHDKGLLHRDIKPSNIMVRDTDREPVLIDFGLARGFIPDRSQQVTIGVTHGFAPPEQYVDFGTFSEATDVYALAATLYYLLTKIPPTAAFLRALNHPLKPMFQSNSEISDALHEAVMQGMEMDATKRPQSVKKWLAMLPAADPNFEATVEIKPPEKSVISSVSPQVRIPTPPTEIPQPKPVKLISARGVDYRELDKLLAAEKWKEADAVSAYKMLEVTRKQEEGWLALEDIREFPCEDLRTIDRLWVQYSRGRFGFSVQRRIYQSMGGTHDYDSEVWNKFGDAVGWRKNGEWLYYNDLDFAIDSPTGNLPWRGGLAGGVMGFGWFGLSPSDVVSRLEKCNI
ncbi:MAG: serine/threonine-protein kinase [Oscillatoriaceae cyanobacterium Prado104]|jgi:serine/threonine protein kinase|nr:serine/threonine-protein kinase [Oscillatoriaceae cyanobacterium Prado104]